MTVNKDKLIRFLFGFAIMSFIVNIYQVYCNKRLKEIYTGDVCWTEQSDTTPKLKDSVRTKVVSVPYVVVSGNKVRPSPGSDTVYINKNEGDTSVTIQLSQKIYEDSNYTAYVSGFKPKLDSIRIRHPTFVMRQIPNEPPDPKTHKTKKIFLGAFGGLGYGLSSNKFEPFLGVGLTYKLTK